MNIPRAITEKRTKSAAAQAARKEKEKADKQHENGGSARLRDWSQPRSGFVAGAIGAPSANNTDGSIPPPPAPSHLNAAAYQGDQDAKGGKGEKGSKDGKTGKKGDKGKGKGA